MQKEYSPEEPGLEFWHRNFRLLRIEYESLRAENATLRAAGRITEGAGGVSMKQSEVLASLDPIERDMFTRWLALEPEKTLAELLREHNMELRVTGTNEQVSPNA